MRSFLKWTLLSILLLALSIAAFFGYANIVLRNLRKAFTDLPGKSITYRGNCEPKEKCKWEALSVTINDSGKIICRNGNSNYFGFTYSLGPLKEQEIEALKTMNYWSGRYWPPVLQLRDKENQIINIYRTDYSDFLYSDIFPKADQDLNRLLYQACKEEIEGVVPSNRDVCAPGTPSCPLKYQTLSSSLFPISEYRLSTPGSLVLKSEDIDRLESALSEYLEKNHPFLRKKALSYGRQYVGALIEGKKIVFGNFFCSAETNWQQEKALIWFDDGGDCYFQFFYNPDTNTFKNFSINGEG